MQRSLSALALALLCAPLSAQVFEETFSFPNGPIIPGWTAQRGTWTINNLRAAPTSGALWAYLTRDGITALDSVVDVEVFHVGTGVQFGGVTSRHPGGPNDANLIMAKVQDNGNGAVLDSCWLYERVFAGTLSRTGLPGMQSARCRMVTLSNTVQMLLDADSNGIYELDIGTKTLLGVFNPGLVGVSAYATSEVDNFKYFDAVLVAPGQVPKIGTTYTMQLRAPQPQGTIYLCAASAKNTGIPIDSRKIPLAADGLFLISLATPSVFNFVGLLDANGDGAPAIRLPNDPALVGIGFFVSGMTLVPSAPSGIGNISNDHYVLIQA